MKVTNPSGFLGTGGFSAEIGTVSSNPGMVGHPRDVNVYSEEGKASKKREKYDSNYVIIHTFM